MAKPDISHERLIQILEYNSETGLFTNKIRRSNSPVGKVIGSIGSHGYIEIRLDDKLYLAHRLAYFYMMGVWPEDEIDHRNLIRTDNSWGNLRDASNSENNANRGANANNVLGVKCVRLRDWGKYQARIRNDGQEIALGSFSTWQEAQAAYLKAANENFGEFARAS